MSGVGGASPEPRDEDFAADVWDSPLEAPSLDEQLADAEDEYAAALDDWIVKQAAEEEAKAVGARLSVARQEAAVRLRKADEALTALAHKAAKKNARARARVGQQAATEATK